MSAFGPKQTSVSAPHMSAFGDKADMTVCRSLLSRSLLGLKRTCSVAPHMSAYDPKRTSDRRRSGPPPVVIGDVIVAVPPRSDREGLPTTFDYGGNTPSIPARRNDKMSDEAAARASVLRNALDSYFKAIAARDPSRLALVFAEDGEFEDPVGTPVIKGRDI